MLAATGVVLCHSYMLLGKIENDPLYNFTGWHLGETSLSVFFLISGYLITQSKCERPQNYWLNRFLRIFPALFVNVLLTAFVMGAAFTSLSALDYFSSSKTYLYLLNIFVFPVVRYLPQLFANNPYDSLVNGSLWTLSSEVLLYFYVWIIASLGLNFKKAVPILLALIAGLYFSGFNYYMRNVGDVLVAIYPDLQLAAFFFIGAAFYIFKIPSNNNIVLLLLFAAAILSIYVGLHKLSLFLLLPYMVFYFAFSKQIKLQNATKFGDFSYGIYIYAYPVQQILIASLGDVSPLKLFALSLSITMIFAALSWHLIEKRALKLKRLQSLIEF